MSFSADKYNISHKSPVTDGVGDEDAERRRQDAVSLANQFYDLSTDFFEYSWGDGFHCAVQRPDESRELSFAKHEYFLALTLGLKSGDTVVVCINSLQTVVARSCNSNTIWSLVLFSTNSVLSNQLDNYSQSASFSINMQNCFCQNFVKFPPVLISAAARELGGPQIQM